jgi:predicted DNA-binding helix-hairpin-helix protein
MPFDARGRLPLDTDPKRAWAEVHLYEAPVEVNRAEREALLRVPGIGPKGADAILAARRRATLRSVDDLRRIGVRTKDIEPFVLLDGRRPAYQLRLFT